jgi:hypothetical protein
MPPTRPTLAILLLLAVAVLAQPGEKPRISIPEPTRERPSENLSGFAITVVKYRTSLKNSDSFSQAIPELIAYFRQTTEIETPIHSNELFLHSERIFRSPLLYMTGNNAVLQIGEKEKENLGNYLKDGGLLYAEDIRQSGPDATLNGQSAGLAGTPFDRQFKALMRDPLVLGNQGKRWGKIPHNHPLYSSYFSFPDGPPIGGARNGNVFDLEMLQLRGRPAVIFSDLNISWYWGDPMADSRGRGLQFGCNLIVYAMTQRAVVGKPPTGRQR